MFRTHFNYGASVSTDDSLYLWPTKGRRTALIDGDMLPYIVGYTKDERLVLRANIRVSNGECASIEDTPEFLDAADHMNYLLNKWVLISKCDSARIFLTDSSNNFRLKVAFSKPYKGQRKEEKPAFFYELRKYLMEVHSAIMSDGNEADDDMSIALMDEYRELKDEHGILLGSPEHKAFAKLVCTTKDKDARITCGHHCEPEKNEQVFTDELGFLEPKWKIAKVATKDYKSEQVGFFTRGVNAGKPKMKRTCIGESCKPYMHKLEGAGLMFFYAQLIMGDTADNYSGLEGKGKAFAYELLKDCKSEKELFFAVLGAYKDKWNNGSHKPILYANMHGKKAWLTPYQLMLEQGRLAWMQQYKGELWRKKDFCPTVEDAVWH